MFSKRKVLLFTVIISLLLSGCAQAPESASTETSAEDEVVSGVYIAPKQGEYDSGDTAIVTEISDVNSTITFYNHELGKSYTLSYDELTRFGDKYGTALSVKQLKAGSIADILFLKSSKLLVSYKESADSFSLSDLSDFTVDLNSKVFRYKNDNYRITDSTVLIAGDKRMTMQDLNARDSITITGFDNEIYCITVDKGHGYLKLAGEEPFLNGYIEIDTGDVEMITENMLMTLTEGSYSVTVTKSGTVATKDVVIEPGKETVLSLRDIEIAEAKVGKVFFDVTPEKAKLYVDGKIVDASKLQEFPLGLHQLSATADGYASVTRYFNVGNTTETIEVTLEADGAAGEEEEADLTDGYYIFISAPGGVEVHFDGNYIGMSPLSFPKKAGSHTITIRKTGHETRSYTVLIENTAKDVYYSFDDLAETSSTNSSNTVSGN